MKNARFKIAALVGGSVLLTLLIILVLFQIISGKNTESRAEKAIRSYTELSADGESTMQYSVNVIEMPNGLHSDPSPVYFYSLLDQHIIDWCRSNEPDDIRKVSLDSHTVYVGIFSIDVGDILSSINEIFEDEADELGEIFDFFSPVVTTGTVTSIIYVDVTAEYIATRNMCFFFLIAALVIGLLGSIEGYMIGRRLELSSKAEKQFFENTSHELKTPLTAIRGYAEGIERGIITDNKKTGHVIMHETEKMSRLIEDILLSAKLESGAMQLHRESLDLAQLMEECMMPMEGAVLSRGLNVRLSLEPDMVSADPDRLEQAISNLITNAVKYAKSRLNISLQYKTLIIENDCDPLSNEELDHLFDRFYTGRNGNTGIGLSLAKDIITLHGWKIRADRGEDGIRFSITY